MKNLMEKMKADKTFAAKYKNLIDFKPFVEQAKKDGFDISAKDVIEMIQSAAAGKLNDADLAAVAGGTGAGEDGVRVFWSAICWS